MRPFGIVPSRAEAAEVVFFEAVHSYAMAAMKAFEAISYCIDSIIVITKITSIQLIFQSVNTLN
ncbi:MULTISPECIES: hypothetical protein [Pseudomonas]|uniref:hypothetical protein n=1 Tax=Pseudomonas TaxID=286 RepID=UPI0018E678FF|nr:MULTISPECIES: hypothetical protein [Pseudomonas]MBI6920195.1 hypothetical protein [Pseudomonas monteilii]MCE0939065.1 hypothetical protein [Pseudomonas kurunegalensis]